MTVLARNLGRAGMIALLGLLAPAPDGARGDIVISDVIEQEIGDPTYVYTAPSVILTTGSSLFSGDFFTLYDLPGLDPASTPPISVTNPLGWSATVQLLGQTPAGVALPRPDSPAISNVTWIYLGPNIDTQVDLDLGLFSIRFFAAAEGLMPPGLELVYAAQTHVGGMVRGNAGIARVTYTQIVPEPSSIVLAGLALPVGLVAIRRRRAG